MSCRFFLVSCDVVKLSAAGSLQVVRREPELNAQLSSADDHVFQFLRRPSDPCDVLLLHADGCAASANVAGDGVDRTA